MTFDPVSNRDPRYVAAIRAHYTESKGAPIGKKIAWEIRDHGSHRGWIALGEPAYYLGVRKRLGIADGRPLPLTVCCTIYRLDAEGPTAASTILRLWHVDAARHWQILYDWTPVHWETMVDPTKVRTGDTNPGACFRRAGYRKLGMTAGFSVRRPEGYGRGPRLREPTTRKLVLYRGPLHRSPA